MVKKTLVLSIAIAAEKRKRKTLARAGGHNKGNVQGKVNERTLIIFG